MRISSKRVVAACALLAACVAQAGVDVDPTLKISAEERYDDDLLLRGEPGANGTGQLMTKVSPQVGVVVKDPSLTVTSWYAADFVVRHTSGNTSLDHRAAVVVKDLLTERLGVDADLRVWRVTDPTSLPRLGMARTLAPILYGRAELSGHYRLSERWTGRVGYHFEGARIYDVGETHGGYVHAPYAEALYQVSRRTDVGARYRYQFFAFGTDFAQANTVMGEYRYRLSPVTLFSARAGAAVYQPRSGGGGGTVPVVNLELARTHEVLDLGVVVGHDLVGASGFTSALWADYASFIGSLRVLPRVQLFWAASYYRNGQPPNFGINPLGTEPAATGYAVGGGLEWRITRTVAVQGMFDRLAQLGGQQGTAGNDLARNIVAARLTVTAF